MNEIISAKNDIVFKILFSNNKPILKAFLFDVLGISTESTDDIRILNPEIPPSFTEGKTSRLDINVQTGGQNINIEMQVAEENDYADRTLFYWSKMYTDSLRKGEKYSKLRKCCSVNILDFNMFNCDSYHSSFSILENQRHEKLTDKFSMHFFELKKVSKELNADDRMQLWMQLINADSKEDFDMLIQTNNPAICDGVKVINDLSNDVAVREMIRQREKAEFDYYSNLAHAKDEGKAIGLSEGKAIGLSEGKAIGFSQGEAEGRARLIARWRERGYTEEQIKDLLL